MEIIFITIVWLVYMLIVNLCICIDFFMEKFLWYDFFEMFFFIWY